MSDTETPAAVRRSVHDVYRYLVGNPGVNLEDAGLRLHAYSDCPAITAHGLNAVEVPRHELDARPERALCWHCVGRMARAAGL